MIRKSWVVAAVCAIFAVLLTGCGSGDDQKPVRPYISSHYKRAPNLDQPNNGRAYLANKRPAATADEITGAARPLDRRTSGNTTYLQYRNDIIAISPNGSGSTILVDDYRNGYRRHHGVLAVFGWASTNPGFRGGGPGSGK